MASASTCGVCGSMSNGVTARAAVAARGEQGQVAGQRVRIAGEIGDRARRQADDLVEHRRGAPLARRVEDDEVGAIDRRQRGRGVAGDEPGVGDSVQRSRGGGGRDGAGVGLDSDDLAGAGRQRERDAADAGVSVHNPVGRRTARARAAIAA